MSLSPNTGFGVEGRQTEPMLAAVNWVVRAAACALIGVNTFAISPAKGGDLVLEVVAYAICILIIALWLASDARRWKLPPAASTVAMGLMAAAAGAACNAPNGGALIGFSAVAVLAAGAETSSMSGWLVIAPGILAAEIGALIFNATTGAAFGTR